MSQDSYTLIDSGNGRKLERFGPYLVSRPASQALWLPKLPTDAWQKAHASLTREGERLWNKRPDLPDSWQAEVSGVTFLLKPTDFGHLGIFPEQRPLWRWLSGAVAQSKRKPVHLLNLFAYSGGATLAAAHAGAKVCHLDASKGMVAWARENAALNGLDKAPIRWIVDDVSKFLAREARRGTRYDAIVLDPPTFGRGSRGEVFKIEEQIIPLLQHCRALLSDDPLFVLLSCHTPGMTPTVLHHLLSQAMEGYGDAIDSGEMVLTGQSSDVLPLPSGSFARWHRAE